MTTIQQAIEKNVRKKIRELRKSGVSAMGMGNLFQITPTPPQELATDEVVRDYRPMFEEIASAVGKEMGFPIY